MQKDLFKFITTKLKEFSKETNFSKAVIGLSGGIDSSVVACLTTKAFGTENVLGLIMPSKYSNNESREDAQELAKNLKIKSREWSIEETRLLVEKQFEKVFEKRLEGKSSENIQPRLRMLFLMAIANQENRLVIGTGNKTEIALGYATLYGDTAGAICPIGDLNKKQVYELAKEINKEFGKVIPQRVFDKKPSAELFEGQQDPFDYENISELVDKLYQGALPEEMFKEGYEEKLVKEFNEKIKNAAFKRNQSPPVIKIEKVD